MLEGMIFSLLTGIAWTCVGVCYSLCAKRGANICTIMVYNSLLALPVVIAFFTRTGSFLSHEISFPPIWYSVFMFAAAFINTCGSLTLQRSMRYGKNSVVWAIGQSALIGPFLSVTLIFNERFVIEKILGTFLVLLGMLFISRKDKGASQDSVSSSYSPSKGLTLAFCAFGILGLAQSMTTSSGHFSYSDIGHIRLVLTLAGGFMAALLGKLLLEGFSFKLDRFSRLMVLILSGNTIFSLIFQFRAIDTLGKVDMSGIFFPVAVGSCIIGVSLYSFIFLRERVTFYLSCGLVSISSGIVCYWVPLLRF